MEYIVHSSLERLGLHNISSLSPMPMKLHRTISIMIASIALLVSCAIASENENEGYFIGNVYDLGAFRQEDGVNDKALEGLVSNKKRLGRLYLSEAAMEFSLKIIKDHDLYATGAVFSKGDGARVRFLKDCKILSIQSRSRVWFFYREAGFDSEDRSKIEEMFAATTMK